MHNDVRLTAPNPRRKVRAGDILVIEAEADALATVLSSLGLKLEEAKQPRRRQPRRKPIRQAAKTRRKGTEKHRKPDETVADTDAPEERAARRNPPERSC